MNETTNASQTTKSRFALTRKNQKGQVAIFVALIFQVIFVFFALLINVGLLVHHKINLQQSTDLAAYYGAMKQAESMNAIAHVNFQIRQAWKLLTWRYRVLGTFGFRQGDGPSQKYPFEHVGLFDTGQFVYHGSGGTPDFPDHPKGMGCDNLQYGSTYLGVQDVPFFCIGHGGFKSWPQTESYCQLDCSGMNEARVIPAIPNATNINVGFGGNVAGAVNQAIDKVNQNINGKCTELGPAGALVLTRFIASYINETHPRLRTIEALAANLSLEADKVLDIEGSLIQTGSLSTLKNNLTEANLTGFQTSSFKAENGLSDGKCRFKDGLTGQEFLKKIEIEFINYFIHNCTYDAAAKFLPQNVYSPNGGLGSAFNNIDAGDKAILETLINPGHRHTVGYEKNPYCVEYYAVKASSEPQIPFLPLTKIKLNAVAVAKPFGGSIGPWYGKTWPRGNGPDGGSDYIDNDQSTKTDENLPIRKLSQVGTSIDLVKSIYSQPNFSLFVDDKMGLRDLDYLAANHSALAMRDINNYGSKTYKSSINTSFPARLINNGTWPDFNNWELIGKSNLSDFREYDGLATNADSEAGTRALEITAIAPNQFDITYYSIDPDFYNNYYKKLYNTGLAKILDATGKSNTMVPNELRADFGAVGMRADQDGQPAPLDIKTFSVKDQILLKNKVLNTSPIVTNGMKYPNTGKTYTRILNYLVSLQSSLLTSWTFLNFSEYDKFPNGTVNTTTNTMSFGQCNDEWNNTVKANAGRTLDENFETPMDKNPKFPPTSGNCVTGGRTGYSVKIISPNVVRGGDLENPIDDSFFSF